MHSVCTQHLWENKYSLFLQNWPLKAGSGEKWLRKANTARSAASPPCKSGSRQSSPLPAGSPWVPRLLGGCSAPDTADAPSPPSTLFLHSPTWARLKLLPFHKKDSVLMKHCFPGSCGNNPDPFPLQLKHWETEKLKGVKKQLIWFLLFKLKEMQKVNNLTSGERAGSLKFSSLGYHIWYIKPHTVPVVKPFPFNLSLEQTTKQQIKRNPLLNSQFHAISALTNQVM